MAVKKKKGEEKKTEIIEYELDQELTFKQRMWVSHFCDCGCATESAKRAGYSDKTAGQIGCENLKKLKKFVEQELEERAKRGELRRTKVTKQERLELLYDEVYSDDAHIRMNAIRELNKLEQNEATLALRRKEAQQVQGGTSEFNLHVVVVKADGTIKYR